MTRIMSKVGRYLWPQGNGYNKAANQHPSATKSTKEALAKERKKEPIDDIAKMVEAIEQDYQFLLGRLIIQALIESANVSIEVEGGARAKALADNLQTFFEESLPHTMEAFGYGRACFERTYSIDTQSNLALVNRLDYLPYEKTEMVLEDNGDFGGVKLKAGTDEIPLEPARVWWFALDPTPLEPHGRSRYLGAPLEVYKQRVDLTDNERVWLSRFALGHGVARAPEAYENQGVAGKGDVYELNEDGTVRNPITDVQQRVKDIESGGVLVLSSKAYEKGGPMYDYTPTVSQPDAGPLENRRQSLDAAALRSLAIPERAITQDTATGSYSMAEVHMQMLFSTVEGVLRQLVSSYQKYVIDKAVAINWHTNQRPILTMVWQPLRESARNTQIAQLVLQIIGGGQVPPFVAEGVVDFAKLLEIAELPVGENLEEKMAAIRGQARQGQGQQQPPEESSVAPSGESESGLPFRKESNNAKRTATVSGAAQANPISTG